MNEAMCGAGSSVLLMVGHGKWEMSDDRIREMGISSILVGFLRSNNICTLLPISVFFRGLQEDTLSFEMGSKVLFK